MMILGLLLAVAGGAAITVMIVQNTDATSATAFGYTTSHLTLGGVFAAGAVAGAVLLLGLAMLLTGAGRRRRRGRHERARVREAREERDQLAHENAQLRAQVADPYPTTTRSEPVIR